jgi:uncharacterized protein (DUF885 family)
MGLEEIEGIRADLKKITEEREFNIIEALASLSNIQKKYNLLLEKDGAEYCNKNCSDIPVQIDKTFKELKSYKI